MTLTFVLLKTMTEDQHYASSVHERQFLNLTVNNGCDFNKYDPYVEKIRALFVPSLEPRIYSCLETFVYPDDHETISKAPYLKRCLDVAANWCEPIDAISTKLANREFLENMLAQAVKYLIKDGLIDCFLNSIILNNRLNNVCRNLDAVGAEKNFLRYLAVWNYINEKDYWIEEDGKISKSTSDLSDDSMESYSDLDVQVGSTIDARRTARSFNKVVKRQIGDHSAQNFCRNGALIENRNNGSCASHQFLSRFDLERNNSEKPLSSHVRRKPRSIRQSYSCRPSNCPTYRTKNSQSGDWRGKTLKLRVCKMIPSTLDNGLAKPIRLSKLSLPCQFDDLFAELVEADSFDPQCISMSTRKKLLPGVTNICCCINETLRKMNREEIRRCRFHCEILTGLITFKLIRREPNGCKVCLFTDRVAIDKISDQNSSQRSLVSQPEDTKQKNPHESEISIGKSERVVLADENLQMDLSLPAEAKTQLEPQVTLRLPENNFDAIDEGKSNNLIAEESLNCSSGNGVNDQACGCKPSFVDELGYLLHKVKGNPEISPIEGTEESTEPNISMERSIEGLFVRSNGNDVNYQTCYCHNSDDKKYETLDQTSKITGDSCVDGVEAPKAINRGVELTPKDSLTHLRENEVAAYLTCPCTTLLPKTTDSNDNSESNQESHCIECVDKSVEDIEASNLKNVHSSTAIEDCQPISCMGTENNDPVRRLIGNEQETLIPPLDSKSLCSESKTQVEVDKFQRGNIGCECPSDTCTCVNKLNDEVEPEECDSQCSCDSCGVPDKLKSVGSLSDASALVNPKQPSRMFSPISNPVNEVLIETSRYLDTTSNGQLQPNCVESQAKTSEWHNPKTHQATSTKSKISFKSSVKNIPSVDIETKEIGTCNSLKSMQTQIEKPTQTTISKIKESRKKSPLPSIRIDTGRASSAKSQRINISIELCSDSEVSEEKPITSKAKIVSPSCRNDFIRSRRIQDFPSMSKPRCHSADARTTRKQATTLLEKNTKDECLRHPRGINAWLHSPSQLLESRDYLPPPESPSRMRNPIMYGMSTKSNVRSASKFERQSMRRHKRRENKESKYSKPNWNPRCYNETREAIRIDKPDESPKPLPRTTIKPKRISPSVVQNNNLCHAFSASSVDRMKNLIKTKLRRILLERDKATNTTNTCFGSDKYRVRVPNGKTKRLPFARPRCHTIWESRSASDSVNTSETFSFNGGTSSAGVSQGDGIKTLFHSTAKGKTSQHKDLDRGSTFDGAIDVTCSCLRNSVESLDSPPIAYPRLVGGSDAPSQKVIDREFGHSFKYRQKSVEKIVNREIEYVSNHCDKRLNWKSANFSCPGDSEVVGDVAVKLSHSINYADCNGEANFNGLRDEIMKYPGKLDWSSTSTSRHIYLYEYNNFESSNDEEEKKSCGRKTCSPSIDALPTCKRSHVEKNYSRQTQKANQKCCKEVKARPPKPQFTKEPRMHRHIRVPSLRPSKIHATSNIKCQKGLGRLDQNLRSKLLQYVNLCKNVKYSLLKMLRPDDIYEISRTSIPCCDRYKLGDS